TSPGNDDDQDEQTASPTPPVAASTAGPPPNASATAASATPNAPGPTATPASGGSSGGAGGPPPTPSRGYGGVPPFIPNYNMPVNASPNTSPASPPTTPEQPVIIKHNAAAPYLLLGYLIGRRRGRIKTEEKLLPIQNKLEKEVKDLHTMIATSEEKIRSLARDQAAAKPAVAEKIAERLEKKHKQKLKAEVTEPELSPQPEHLGKLAVKPEQPKPESTPAELEKPSRPEPIKVPPRPKAPEQMSVAELLVIAEHIPAEHGSVKKLYETRIINEEGLRRVAQAYLRGERYEKIIQANRKTGETPVPGNPEHDPKSASSSQDQASGHGPADNFSAPGHVKPRWGRSSPAGSSVKKEKNSTTPVIATAQTVLIAGVVIVAVLLILFLLR
ncbi:MAG TPA: hypothetical protein VM124_03485, partial [Candidatus Limnocylindrales bacterium]|nr:hypothetical protein [Candidatus Limnocylindrales bacterium]